MPAYKDNYLGKWFMTEKMDPFFVYKIKPAKGSTYYELVLLDEEGFIDKTAWSIYWLKNKLHQLENVQRYNRSCMKGIFIHTGKEKVNF